MRRTTMLLVLLSGLWAGESAADTEVERLVAEANKACDLQVGTDVADARRSEGMQPVIHHADAKGKAKT